MLTRFSKGSTATIWEELPKIPLQGGFFSPRSYLRAAYFNGSQNSLALIHLQFGS